MKKTRRRRPTLQVCTYRNPGGDEYQRVTIGAPMLRDAGFRLKNRVAVNVEPGKITLTPVESESK